MKRKIFITLLLFFFTTNINIINANFSSENRENIVKVNLTKKDLKNEIKKRKKYHKTLLENYNKNFEKKYFDLIVENSLILSNLRQELNN